MKGALLHLLETQRDVRCIDGACKGFEFGAVNEGAVQVQLLEGRALWTHRVVWPCMVRSP